MKIRLVGGPMGGKVKDVGSLYGQNIIVMRDFKRETRAQKYDRMRSNAQSSLYAGYASGYAAPTVEARYEISRRIYHQGETVITAPCYHPDGSLFYVYMEGSKREFH